MSQLNHLLQQILEEYYSVCTDNVVNRQLPIVWSSAFVPVEILRAWDLPVFYPESFAAMAVSLGLGTENIARGESYGFGRDICSYARIVQGIIQTGKIRNKKLPKPDLLIATNNQCGTINFWWQHLAQMFKVPVFMLDLPKPIPENKSLVISYAEQQIYELIKWMENHLHVPFPEHKFIESVYHTRLTNNLWLAIHDERKRRPVPVSIPEMTNAMFPMVTMRGKEITTRYYQVLLNEIQTRTVPDDNLLKKRLFWYGYPFWFDSKRVPLLTNLPAEWVMDNYTLWWNFSLDQTNIYRSLAEVYTYTYLNLDFPTKMQILDKLVADYNIDGVVVHCNRSCKRDGMSARLVVDYLQTRKVPVLLIDGDMAAREDYHREQVDLKIETFVSNYLNG